MCAIAGMFDLYRTPDMDPALLERMVASQRHRGPDDGGHHLEPGLALGHRRLSIIDRSGGQQPLYNEDRQVMVVYNGEIYNYQALMRELRQFGHQFRTQCDTEVIVHAWEQWGEHCVEHFRGMFAFALWDRRQQVLFLARDRLGVKPLHYALLEHGQLIFSSELKALRAHPRLDQTLDPCAVEEYFAYGYIPDPRTIYAQARKLPPGHTLTVRKGRPLPPARRYWDVPFTPVAAGDDEQTGEELVARLREAVRIRLVSEVPVGAFLSGGVDSSAVVAMMAQQGNGPVNTCAIGFSERGHDESAWAELVARRYRTCHRSLTVDHDDLALLDLLPALYDEPYADSSALPTYRVCQLARQHVTVALSGDGGDEIFAGYRRYRLHLHEERWRRLLPAGLRRPLFGTLGRLYPKADWAPRPLRARTTLQALARNTVEAYAHSVALLPETARLELYSDAFRRTLDGYRAVEVMRRHAGDCPSGHPLSLVQYLDLKTYLPGDILTKVDRASMAHGLEVRVPLLDHQLVEWVSGLPPRLKLRGGTGKYLLKQALHMHLPAEVLHRPKQGFAVPMAAWLRGPLRARLLSLSHSTMLGDSGMFDLGRIQLLADQHLQGRAEHGPALWSLLMFDAFLRQQQRLPAQRAA